MSDFTLSRRDDGIAIVAFDAVDRTMNTLTANAWDILSSLIDEVAGDDAITGAVIVSSKRNAFCAGADLDEIIDFAGVSPSSPDEAERRFELLFKANAVARRIETCGKPFVAAISGLALGGGFELALACHHRVAADVPNLKIGLPEATIGLLPGGGGIQRVVRLVGVEASLPLLVDGKTLAPRQALELGLVDELAPPDALPDAAVRWLHTHRDPVARWDREGFSLPGGVPESALTVSSLAAIAGIPAERIANYPAVANILAAICEGVALPMSEAIRVETRYFLRTLETPQAKAMIRTVFRSLPALRKGTAGPVEPIRRAAVLGAGMMGAGIAYSLAKAGIDTVLLDVSDEAAAAGKAYSEKLLTRLTAKGGVTLDAADALLGRIMPTSDYTRVAGADLLIETVFEDVTAKGEATAKALAYLPDDVLVATNTSTLPITTLASVHPKPETFLGMHFHSPVDRMELVEVVKGHATSKQALDRAMAAVRQIGKTSIVANDSPFFYTSRVFDTYIREGMEMLVDGFAADDIDRIGKETGMPRGPLELTDDVAVDLIGRIAAQRVLLLGEAATRRRSDDVVDLLLGEARYGRKNGKGFYTYSADGTKHVWELLAQKWPTAAAAPGGFGAGSELGRRFIHRQAVEAALCLAEGVLDDPRHADVGAILGWSFPKWTGGPISYIEQIGISQFVAECDALATRWGDRFVPPEMLRRMAASGETFYDGLRPKWTAR
jgi:3-hydroxyacyl-CoA dehydrogenase / enoyl-CoA hydratase / 3-hydroxybutyryl-CoA epimerase